MSMNLADRRLLLELLMELSEAAPEQRFGQLVLNLATLARGATVEAAWDVEDDELIGAARRLLERFAVPADAAS